jgi:hypothetical protein
MKSKRHQLGFLPRPCPDQDQQWWLILVDQLIPKTAKEDDQSHIQKGKENTDSQ